MPTIAEILVDGVPVDKLALRDYLVRREVANVQDFGADPSGRTDGAPVIQAAINGARGRPVYVPPGTYRIDTPLSYRAPAIVDGHIPGLQLIGAGPGLSRFDCRIAEGAALRIEQSIGYTFSQNGLISGLEFRGDGADRPGQDAIFLSGAWHYRFADLRIRGFGRHGITCPYRHDLGYRLTGVAVTRGSDRLTRPAGGLLTRLRPGDRVTGPGLPEPSSVLEVVDDRTVRISAPAIETGIIDATFGGNTDAFQSIVHLERCNIEGNGGWGIEGSAGLGLLLSWTDTAVQECRAGGVKVGGGTRLVRGIIAANGRDGGTEAAGLRLIRAPGTPQLVHVENIEFDSNHGIQAWLHYVANATFYQCRFISHVYPGAGMVPPVGVHLGGRDGATGNARNVEFEQCAWRADAQHGLPFCALAFGTTGSYSNIRVRAPLWITLTPPHQVKYAPEPHPDSAVRIEEAGSVTLAAGPARPTLILRKLQPQAIPPDADTAIVFESTLQASGFADGRVAVAQSYWLEVWFAVDGLGAGDDVAVNFTVDDAIWRQGYFRAGGMTRETFQLHCVAPLPLGARVGARIHIRTDGQPIVVGGPGVAGFSVVALS